MKEITNKEIIEFFENHRCKNIKILSKINIDVDIHYCVKFTDTDFNVKISYITNDNIMCYYEVKPYCHTINEFLYRHSIGIFLEEFLEDFKNNPNFDTIKLLC